MKVDVYDTYATAPDGSLMHFKFHVPEGTSHSEVVRLAQIYVAGEDPEIEAERRYTNLVTRDPSILIDLRRNGFSVHPLHSAAERAA